MITGPSMTKPILEHTVWVSRGEVAEAWLDNSSLRAWAINALDDLPFEAEINVRLCDESEMRQLNLRFAAKDKPTNVLAFCAQSVSEPWMRKLSPRPLGDIVVCAPVVDREASDQAKTRDQHCAHLITHGVLHLLGLDHQDDVQAERMERRESELLAQLGFPDPYAVEMP